MTRTKQDGEVTLATVDPGDLPAFKADMEASFAVAVIEEFGFRFEKVMR
ncbi:hypothetical protein [Azospirillum sp. BE72]|nr:hypothetical protein [Azospirillum sp. BE72]MDR6771691.1 hypothetical protein [Azospirillum sp. BE72]